MVSGLFRVETELNVLVHIKELRKAKLAPDRKTIPSLSYRFAVELKLSHKLNNEEEMVAHKLLRSSMDTNLYLSAVVRNSLFHKPTE